MPKRISTPVKKKVKRPTDVNQLAQFLVNLSTQEDEVPEEKAPEVVPVSRSEISRVMAAMGRKGGKIGGKRRLETMTKEERSQIGLKAAQARWAKNH